MNIQAGDGRMGVEGEFACSTCRVGIPPRLLCGGRHRSELCG